jgi:putative intracellular protease/amidase
MAKDPNTIRTVHLYVCDGFADWEPAHAVAGINNPAFQQAPGRWRVRTVGDSTDLVRSMGGLAVLPDMPIDLLSPAHSALLILPGGAGWDTGLHAAGAAKAEEFLAAGVPVAAICGATAGLARRGLLDARRHTSNAATYLAGTGYAGREHYVDESAVADRGLVTAGGMSALEFARAIFTLLDIYKPEVLEEWYALNKQGAPVHFARMQRAAEEAS